MRFLWQHAVESPAQREIQVLKVRRDRKGPKASLDRRVLLARRGPKDLKVRRAIRGMPDL